jgi:hypothetical protein
VLIVSRIGWGVKVRKGFWANLSSEFKRHLNYFVFNDFCDGIIS